MPLRLLICSVFHMLLPLPFIAFLSLDAHAKVKTAKSQKTFQSRSVGHLLASNNQLLEKKQWGLGTMYAGYGVSESTTVAVSPFVLFDFNMINLQTRSVWQLTSTSRFGLDLGFYKSINPEKSEYHDYCVANSPTVPLNNCTENIERMIGYKKFKMEALALKATYSQLFGSYRSSATLAYFHYIDDERPFSFRMDPANSDKYAVSITSLHEFKVGLRRYLSFEAGFWGLNYQHPYYHTGLTYNYQTENWVFSFGASSTFNPNFPKEKVRKFVYYDSRWSLHPEIQIQRFF